MPETSHLAMKQRVPSFSNGHRSREIAVELAQLFQQQVEMTRWEAFVGFTPSELQEYDRLLERIRELYAELGKLNSAH